MSIETDLNSYFEYVDKVIEDSGVIESEKKYYRDMISFYKITSRVSLNFLESSDDYSEINMEEELYILYEILSFRFLKLLNYWAWRKRKKYGIL